MKSYKVVIYKKKGYKDFETGDADKVVLRESIIDIRINRSLSTSNSEATVRVQYENIPKAVFSGGTKGIIDNFAKIEIYIDNSIQFTGIIKKYQYNTDEKVMELSCHDMYYRLTNTSREVIKYKSVYATEIIKRLCSRAGCSLSIRGGNDYIVESLEIDIDTQYGDVISNLVETMHARLRAGKNGIILLEDAYPEYDEKDHSKNHYDFEFNTTINTSEDKSSRDASHMKNILRVVCQNEYSIYENLDMTSYLNEEEWFKSIDNPLAKTERLRKEVAGHTFLDMWRSSTSIHTVPAKGTPGLDIGQVIRINSLGTYSGYYLVISLDTSISADEYTDSIQMQGLRDKTKVYSQAKILESGLIEEIEVEYI